MTELEYHVIRTTTTIKSVNLAVRFPCSLTFQLKDDNNVTDGRGSHELKAGICQPNEKLNADVDVLFRNGEYADKKLLLIVLMSSVNGRIPAGSITLRVSQYGKLIESIVEESRGIDKCPDRSAKATFSTKFQFVRTYKKQNDPVLSRVAKMKASNSMSPISMMKSMRGSHSQATLHQYREQKMKAYIENQLGSLSRKNQEEGSAGNSIIYEQFEEGLNRYKSKVGRLERQKLSNRKEIAKLKGEIYTLKREDHWNGYEEQVQKYKAEMDALAIQLSSVKDRNKILERKERQQNSQIKDLKEQVQKWKNKASAAENLHFQMKVNLDERQKIVRTLNEEIRVLKEEIEDQKISINMQEKRVQFKEITFREQLQKLTEKYQQSETQRQKLTFQINNLLSQFEASEKKAQLQFKEKERSLMEDKSKLTKKNQHLTASLKSEREENEDLKTQVQQLQNIAKTVNKSKEALISELQESKARIITLEASHRKMTSSMSQKDRQIEELTAVEQQFLVLKKKYAELTLDHTKIDDSLAKANKQINALHLKNVDLDAQIKDLTSSKKSLNQSLNESKKQITVLKKSIQSKNMEISSLNDTINSLTSRFTDTKLKLDSQKIEFEEMNGKISAEVTFLMKTKDHLQNEIEEMRWKIQKDEEYTGIMDRKCSQFNDQILRLNEDLINQQENNKSLRQIIKDNENKVEQLQSDLLTRQAKQKELQAMVKKKTEIEYEIKKSLKEKEQEVYLLKEKSNQLQLTYREKVEAFEVRIQEKQYMLDQFKRENKELGSDLSTISITKEQSLKSLERMEEQIRYYKQSLEDGKRKINGLESQINEKSEQIQRLYEERKNQLDKRLLIESRLTKKQEELKTMSADWDSYQNRTHVAMEQFLSQVSLQSGKQSRALQLLAFPDEHIATLQIHAIKKRNQIMNKLEEKIKQLEDSNDLTGAELQKFKDYSKRREEELEQIIQLQKQRYRELSSAFLLQKNELMEQLMSIEQKNHEICSENEKLTVQVNRIKEQSQFWEKCHSQQRVEKEKLEEEIKKSEKAGQEMKRNREISEQNSQNDFRSILGQKEVSIEKLKNNVRQLQKKLLCQEKDILERQQAICKAERSLSDATHSNEKLQKKLQYEQIKYGQLVQMKKNAENEVRVLESGIKQIQEEQEKAIQELNAEKFKTENLTMKINKALEQIEGKDESIKAQKEEIQVLGEKISSLQNQNKKLSDKCKQLAEKLGDDIKQLQQKIIIITSELQLKGFLLEQSQTNHREAKQFAVQLGQEISKKKQDIIQLQQSNEDLKNEIIFLHQSQESLTQEKESIESEYHKQKSILHSMNSQVIEHTTTSELLLSKEREVERLRQNFESNETRYEHTIKELRQNISDLRKEVSQKSIREQEFKRQIREYQKELQSKTYEFEQQLIKFQEEAHQQKYQLLREMEILEKQNNNIRKEYQYIHEQTSKQIDLVNQQCVELTGLVAEKEELLISKNQLIRKHQNQIKILSIQLKNCVEGWEKYDPRMGSSGDIGSSSLKYKMMIDEIDSKSKNLANRSRRVTSNTGQDPAK